MINFETLKQNVINSSKEDLTYNLLQIIDNITPEDLHNQEIKEFLLTYKDDVKRIYEENNSDIKKDQEKKIKELNETGQISGYTKVKCLYSGTFDIKVDEIYFINVYNLTPKDPNNPPTLPLSACEILIINNNKLTRRYLTVHEPNFDKYFQPCLN